MFEYFKKIVANDTIDPKEKRTGDKKLQVATCALFFEMAKADDVFTDEEKSIIRNIMKDKFYLNDDEIDELFLQAEESIKKSVSIYEFATLIDKGFSREEKFELMKNLWRIIYTDDVLDKYEDNLIKRIGDILKLEHKDVIDAKLIIKQELNL